MTIKIFKRKDIVEINYGEVEGKTLEERKRFGWWNVREDDKLNYRLPSGESYADGLMRVVPFIVETKISNLSTILIVGHEGINRLLVDSYLDLDPSTMVNIRQPNQIVYVVDTINKTCSWIDGMGEKKGEGYRTIKN